MASPALPGCAMTETAVSRERRSSSSDSPASLSNSGSNFTLAISACTGIMHAIWWPAPTSRICSSNYYTVLLCFSWNGITMSGILGRSKGRTLRGAPCLRHAEKASSAFAACTQSLRADASAAKYSRCSSQPSILSCFLHLPTWSYTFRPIAQHSGDNLSVRNQASYAASLSPLYTSTRSGLHAWDPRKVLIWL